MLSLDPARLAEDLLPIVLGAGRIEMQYFASGIAVDHKADRSPVTAADREAEAMLVEGLAAVAPGIPVIAEELTSAGNAPVAGDTFFLVDPLDGTREFIRNGPEFTINIGLVLSGKPVFGLIYAPALARLYVTLGLGIAVMAHMSPSCRDPRLGPKDVTILRTKPPDPMALVALESRSRQSPGLDRLLRHHKVSLRKKAASSLKFCLVAAGEADLYAQFGDTSEWDTAAGEAILVAAGGAVTTLDDQPLTYGRAERGFGNPSFLAWGRKPPLPW